MFHLLLMSTWLPVVTLPFAWWAAVWSAKRAKLTGSKVWSRRLWGLAVVDTFVAAAVIGLYLTASALPEGRAAPAPYVIGVEILESGEGVRIRPIEDSPADEAGLRLDDWIEAIDDEPIASADDLIDAVSSSDSPRVLHVRRGGEHLVLEVVPSRGARSGGLRAGRRGLFEPERALSAAQCRAIETPTLGGLLPYLLALVLGLGLLWRLRALKKGRLVAFALVLVGSLLVGTAARLSGCVVLGGHAPGTLLLGLLGSGGALALGGLLLTRGAPAGPLLPPLPTQRVVASSLYYVFTWVPRAFVLSFGALGLARWVAQTGTPLDAFADIELGLVGGGLLFLGVAVLGPLAEEAFFRGALLPELGKVSPPWVAIGLSSALFGAMHVHHGLAIVGPFVIGTILGWARARTSNIAVSVGLHMAFNAGSLLLFVWLP